MYIWNTQQTIQRVIIWAIPSSMVCQQEVVDVGCCGSKGEGRSCKSKFLFHHTLSLLKTVSCTRDTPLTGLSCCAVASHDVQSGANSWWGAIPVPGLEPVVTGAGALWPSSPGHPTFTLRKRYNDHHDIFLSIGIDLTFFCEQVQGLSMVLLLFSFKGRIF